MRYVIDGYNLLHATGHLCGKVAPHGLEKARLALLGLLHGFYGSEAAAVTVVFDARGAPPGVDAEQEYHGLHVRFAVDQEADDLIEEFIQQDSGPRQLTVISDDHRLQRAARRRQCLVLGCLDYHEQITRPRQHPGASTGETAAKPDTLSPEEAARWLKIFGDLDNDPRLREGLNFGLHGREDD